MSSGGLGCFETMKKPKLVNYFNNIRNFSPTNFAYLYNYNKYGATSSTMDTFLSKFGIIKKNVLATRLRNITILGTKISPYMFDDVIQRRLSRILQSPSSSYIWNNHGSANINKFATLLAVLVDKTSDPRFSIALNTCLGPRQTLFSNQQLRFIKQSTFTRVLNSFEKVVDEIVNPISMYFDVRYHNFDRARVVSHFVDTFFTHFNINLKIYFSLNLISLFGNHKTYYHTM